MAVTVGTRIAGVISGVTAWVLRLKPVRALLLYSEHRGPMLADSVTYRALFSIFAGVLLGFSVAGLWLAGNPTAWDALVSMVDTAIPGLIGENGIVDPAGIAAPAGLTLATVLSLIGLIGAALGAIGSLRTALHTLADTVHDDVFWIWVLLRNLALALGIGAALLVSAGATFFGTAFIGEFNSWLGISPDHPAAQWATRLVSVLVVFLLDAAVIAVLFRVLSGVRASARSLWSGALLGAVGLSVLQQLSGLFVGGAAANPLLTSFAALIALLLWVNLSVQVILIASAYVLTGVEEERDRVVARFGASTFVQRRLRRAEHAMTVASKELAHARADDRAERAKTLASKDSAATSDVALLSADQDA